MILIWSKESFVEDDPIRLEVGPILGARGVVPADCDYVFVQSVFGDGVGAGWPERKPLAEFSCDGGVAGTAEVCAGREARNGDGARVRRASADCSGSGKAGDNIPRIQYK